MATIIRPFEWPHLLIPILPDSLYEILEAPIPLIIGLPGTLPTEWTGYKHVIWVDLDDLDLRKRLKMGQQLIKEVKQPYSNGIQQRLEVLFKHIPTNRPLFNPSSEQMEIIKEATKLFRGIWTDFTENLPERGSFSQNGRPVDVNNIKSEVLIRASYADQQFLTHFVLTQIFINYVDEIYKSVSSLEIN